MGLATAYTKQDYGFLFLGSLFYFILILFSLNNAFFGDCVNLGSRYAHWFLESGFTGIIPPSTVDSGNPPFFGLYLGAWWAVFGRSLAVAHLAMLPFLLGMVVLFHRLARYFFEGKWIFVALIPLLLEPTLLAQATMLSPDIPLTFFFLMAVVGLIYKNNSLQILGIMGMPLLSTRGMMTVAVIFVAEILMRFFKGERKIDWKAILKYFPAALVAVGWLGYHYVETGWVSYNRETMPWASSFDTVSAKGYIRNLCILAWRMLDFGRVAWYFVAFGLAWAWWRFRSSSKGVGLLDTKFYELMALVLAPCLVFLPILARYTGLLQHRYLIQIFLMFGLLVCYALYSLPLKPVFKKVSLAFIGFSLITGHLWIYPAQIAQGWDASLAHVPYFSLRDKMTNYILEHKISPSEVVTGTPNQFSYKETNAINDTWTYTHIGEVDPQQAKYVFYSNAFNDIPDDFVAELFTEWTVLIRYQKMGVEVVLFEK